MSWGERSCKHFGHCPIPAECTYETCNTGCRMYESNGRPPDDQPSTARSRSLRRRFAEAEANDLVIKLTPAPPEMSSTELQELLIQEAKRHEAVRYEGKRRKRSKRKSRRRKRRSR